MNRTEASGAQYFNDGADEEGDAIGCANKRKVVVTGLSPEDIEAFVAIFEASDWEQVDLVIGDFELHLSKNTTPAPGLTGASGATVVSSVGNRDAALQIPTTPPLVATGANWIEIQAPHLGTFYRAPKPGHESFVEVGQIVSADTEVCLLEVMKLFTALRAGVSGVIRKICVPDATLVEGGQVLFMVEPTP
jgi:acetyl-CoA carboxylase biotin carboxyl carrier protein